MWNLGPGGVQRRGKLENFKEDGDKIFLVEEGPPQKLISFDPFVFCLWTILLFFLIFLSFSSPIFHLQNFRGDVPLTENFRGDISHPPPVASTACGGVEVSAKSFSHFDVVFLVQDQKFNEAMQ